jgi:hypothetical protein
VASKAQVENAILEREGFRVEFELFQGKPPSLPAYDYPVMAPQRWKVSDWKNARLAAYRLLVKGATIYGGDGKPIPRDLQLGNLRDTYYKSAYGSVDPPSGGDTNVIALPQQPHRKKSDHNGKSRSRKGLN